MRMRVGLVISWLSLGSAAPALAWGPEGHAVIADVADAHLTPKAKSIVKTLLGHSTMAGVSSWADTVRNQRPETYNWHFVDIEIENPDYVPTRDCPQTPKGDCALAAIDRYKVVLANTKAPKGARTEALKFLIHFVGDIHQPLHCADHHDRGGNDVQVKYCGHGTNLHHAWDSDLISSTGLAESDYRAHVEAYVDGLSSDEVAKIQSGTPTDWVLASHGLAVEDSYKIPTDKDLCGVYTDDNLVVIDQQLADGGLRLAKVLNDILVTK
jgi:nuclease S1